MRMRSVLSVFFIAHAAAQYPVWSSISTIGSSLTSMDSPPPGCSCVDTSSPCTKFDCSCVCNLNAKKCDANCCCDPDCSATEIARVTASGACLAQGPVNRTLKSCADLDVTRALVYVNPRPRMIVENSALLDNVLCITVDNSPITGTYLGAQGVVPASTLSTAGVARKASYISTARTAPYLPASAAQAAGVYLPGERVAAAVNISTSSSLRAVSSGWWALPWAGPAGTCGSSAAAFATFRTTVPPTQCTRPAAALSATTCEAFSATRLVNNLYLGKTPLASPGTTSGYVGVTIGKVTLVDATSGATSSGNSDKLNYAFTSTASECSCAGVVTAVSYVASYDGVNNRLGGVEASVSVTTLNVPPAQCASGASPLFMNVPITVAVSWVDTAATATSPAHQDARSGAPGYIMGAPLLAGVLVAQSGASTTSSLDSADKLGVVRGAPFNTRLAALANLDVGAGFSTAGLSLRGPDATGACVSSSSANDTASIVPVRFGEDISMSCHVNLDSAAFNALCASTTSTSVYMGMWTVNASTTGGAAVAPTHVGTFGNADPWKYYQWTAMSSTTTVTAGSLDSVRGVCRSIPAALNIEFLYADVGEAGNPQSEIIAARSSYAYDTWSFLREDVRDTTNSLGFYGQQRFLLKTSVTFHKYPTTSRSDYVAPVPPIISNVPSDLWCACFILIS